ncbi:hypothetical protein AcW1_006995 [Taiwanofungus camphoratus]|nr:hypothetical protein AcV5_002797 [Antrodia cinnamomea]KAI0955398.1 hypothetical protein AcW1_006995 [Antrodia cinnamomea]
MVDPKRRCGPVSMRRKQGLVETLKKTIRTRFQFHQWRRLFHASFYQEQVGLPSPKTPNEFCELAECWHGIGLVQMAVENVSEVYNSILYSASVFNRLAVQVSIVDYVDEGLRRVTSASVLQIGVYRRVVQCTWSVLDIHPEWRLLFSVTKQYTSVEI